MTNGSRTLSGLRLHLTQPVDGASLAAFRILLGLVMVSGLVRFLLSGWVEELLVRPSYFFKYPGLEWLPVWEPQGLHIHIGVAICAALCVAVGFAYRVSCLVFIMSFLSLQAMDMSNYLNHYYLVVILFSLLLCMPAHRNFSVDQALSRRDPQPFVPRWVIYLLRFQVAMVYLYAAIAKIGTDWLLYAQPMSIWLSARTHLPVIGPYLTAPELAFIMSWAGLVYDLTIVGFLLWARTRVIAYCAVLVFHGATWALFDIGMFPIIMVTATTIFFSPSWPRKMFRLRVPDTSLAPSFAISKPWLVAGVIWMAFQAVFPARHYFYDGNVLWNENGMRYAWKVMVREKMGSITYRVVRHTDGRRWDVNPARYLEPRQLSEMSGQPDLIVQLAHFIHQDFARLGKGDVAVKVDALVSLNGRPAARLIDPDVDLIQEGWRIHQHVLPLPNVPPLDPRRKGR